MSVYKKMPFNCPYCGETAETDISDRLDCSENPKAKRLLLSGELFLYKCPKCGKAAALSYPLLYIDNAHRVVIQYANNERNFKPSFEVISQMHSKRSSEPDGGEWFFRVVSKAESLAEKAALFDRGLDDRVVELVKLMVYVKIIKERPEIKISQVLFSADDIGYIVRIGGSHRLTVRVGKDAYEKISKDMHDIITAPENQSYQIDEKWAARVSKLK